MALIDKLTAISNAIRSKTGGSSSLSLTQMATDISALVVPDATTTFTQINTQVAKYISEVTYDPSDYSYSDLSTYVIATDYEKSKPFGAAVTLPSAGTLTIQDGAKSMSYAASSGSNTIYNITPGGTGAYYLKNSSDKIIAAGLLKPTGSLRMINASATYNIRDLGGWSCDGGTVKYGRLFRGGEIAAADAALFHDLLGIRAELNLRWDSEVQRDYSLIGSDVDFRHIPAPWYSLGTDSRWPADALKQILNYVMDNAIDGRPLYFHCAGGADRTGTVAFILESFLGMSQSDTDKEYELTSFYSGIGSDSDARRRDEAEWRNLMAAFSGYQGSIMRDKVVNWALTQGIAIEKINAFRAAMIDGTPQTLSGSVGSAAVAKTLTGVSSDNSAATNAMYQPYEAKLTPDAGKVITAVQVTMGGVDITDAVFSGRETAFRYAVSYSLSNCALAVTPGRKAVISGECFCCEVEADSGYTLEGATVSITMGGTDVSTYYKDGSILIPRVTGNIAISVTAAASAPAYTNQITQSTTAINGSEIYNTTGYKDGYRYSSSMAESAYSGSFITGYIHIKPGDVVRLYGNILTGNESGLNTAFYKANGTVGLQVTPHRFHNGAYTTDSSINAAMSNIVFDSANDALKAFTWAANYEVWAKFDFVGSFSDGVTVVTINEEM